MEAVILAAGEGLRMRPLTNSMPKVMLRLANKPILEHAIEALIRAGVRDIVMVVGYRKEHIMSYFEDGKKWGARIRYAHEKKQLGTAHALKMAKDMVSGPFLVYPGDNILGSEAIFQFIKNAQKGSSKLLVIESAVPAKYGFVVTSGNKISGIRKDMEPSMGTLISTGVYMFNEEMFPHIEEMGRRGVHTLTDVVMAKIESGGELEAVVAPGRWMDTVYPWDMIGACEKAMEDMDVKTQGSISQKATIIGPVSIGKDSVIREGCTIKGPAIIGDGCEIGPNVVISPSTAIGSNVKIDPFVRIENSIIMDDSTIGAFSWLSHSVIAEGVNIDGHFCSMVSRADVKTSFGFKEVKKIGVVIAEDTTVGPHVTSMPGTIIGAKSSIGPMARLQGRIPNGSMVV